MWLKKGRLMINRPVRLLLTLPQYLVKNVLRLNPSTHTSAQVFHRQSSNLRLLRRRGRNDDELLLVFVFAHYSTRV
jgi:hypothetical protein